MLAANATNGFHDAAAYRSRVRSSTLCVHFTGRGAEHGICFAEAAPQAEVIRACAARLAVEWDEPAGGVLRGRVLLRGEVACDAYLLTGDWTAADREHLRAQGLPRERAALLARMPERPLLCTIARGPAPSPQLLRRIHSLLLA